MTLRRRTLIAIGLALTALIGINAAAFVFMLGSFSSLEDERALRGLSRCLSVLDDRRNGLASQAEVLAGTDDIMRAVLHPDKVRPLAERLLLESGLDAVAVFDSKGRPLGGVGVSFESGQVSELAAGFTELGRGFGPISWRGGANIVRVGGRIMFVARGVIGGRERNSDPHGLLLLGKFIDNREIRRLNELSGVQALIYVPDPYRELTGQVRDLGHRPSLGRVTTESFGSELTGYAVLTDQDNAEVAMLRTVTPRDIREKGRRRIGVLLVATLSSGACLGAIVLYFLEKSILFRLGRLNSEVEAIGADNVPARISREGKDEISDLAEVIERTFVSLARSLDETRLAEQRLRTMVDYTLAWEYWLGPGGELILTTPSCLRLTGYSDREFAEDVGLINRLVHSADQSVFQDQMRTVLIGGGPMLAELRIVRKDGDIRWITHAVQRVDGDSGERLGLRASCQDISERKYAESMLREAKVRAEMLYRVVPSAVFTVDLNGRIMTWNRRAEEITGFTEADVRGQSCLLFTRYPCVERCDLFNNDVPKPIRGRECQIKTRDGRSRIIVRNADLLCDASGRISGGIESFDDITERKAAETALRVSEAKFRLMFDQSPIGAAIVSMDGDIMQCNSELCRFTGYSASELIEMVPSDLIRPDDFEIVLERQGELMSGAIDHYVLDIRFVRKDVGIVWGGLSVRRIYDEPGGLLGGFYLPMIVDIDERKRLEDDLVRARESAEAASRTKSEFLAKISHEVRTPLNGILGMLQIIERKPGVVEAGRQLDLIGQSAEGLLGIINDILDIAKMESGTFTVVQGEMDLGGLCRELAGIYQGLCAARGLEFVLRLGADVPEVIMSDRIRLRQILFNILSNAVKFTRIGRVELEVSSEVREGTAWVVFTVSDTGIGVPPDRLEAIFESFVQADDSLTRTFGGTGLGLPIADNLVRLLGGERIEVESEVGRGSRFRFSLPTGVRSRSGGVAAKEEDVAFATTVDLGRVNVLVAEDNEMNRYMLETMLKISGVTRIAMVDDGEMAVIETLAADPPIDIVLMDIQMPGCDGLTATRRLRAEGWTGPIVAVTAHAMEVDKVAAREAGVTAYLTKPYRYEELVSVISSYVS